MAEQTNTPKPKTSSSLKSAALPRNFIGSTGAGECTIKIPSELSINSSFDEILLFARNAQASDVHLSINYPVMMRKFEVLKAITKEKLSKELIKNLLQSSFEQNTLAQFMSKGGVEFVYTIKGGGRYRITLMKTRSGLDLTARIIPASINSFEASGMPESCKALTKWAQGLIIIAGPTGCGKTSSLATLVDMINQNREDHIITIENPIEIVYQEKKCQITQREIDLHTLSQANALKAALRQDPDIIVISELRDLDTIQLAVTAAETGHLVLGTMNTLTSSQTISSLIDSFPPEEQEIITVMISESLRGIICQQLIPKQDGSGMVPAFEVLNINTAVANLIREGKLQTVANTIATSKADGMVLFDNSLKDLINKKIISGQEAYNRATTPKNFEQFVKGN